MLNEAGSPDRKPFTLSLHGQDMLHAIAAFTEAITGLDTLKESLERGKIRSFRAFLYRHYLLKINRLPALN